MPATFEVYRDKEGKFRWRLLHHSGQIIADSTEGYESKAKAMNGINNIKEKAPALLDNIKEKAEALIDLTKETNKEDIQDAEVKDISTNINMIRTKLESLVDLQKASEAWHWRLIAIIVALATVGAFIFEILNYFKP